MQRVDTHERQEKKHYAGGVYMLEKALWVSSSLETQYRDSRDIAGGLWHVDMLILC